MADRIYHRYAGKALPGAGDACHLLAYHNLDVAAVGWYLLSPERALSQELARALHLKPASLRRFLVCWLGLHDLGKFSRAFQNILKLDVPGMVPPLAMPYTERHDRLGAVLWQSQFPIWWSDGTLRYLGPPLDRVRRRALSAFLPAVAAPFFGHHGQPVAAGAVDVAAFFGADRLSDDRAAAAAFVADWATLIGLEWPLDHLVDPDWQAVFKSLSWTIAGWATLSDWLGSNRAYFRYRQTAMPLDDYWPMAQAQAAAALASAGLAERPVPVAYQGLSHWFERGASPTPLQSACEAVALDRPSQMFVLEDLTGAGKTEAACILAQRLLAAGHGDGLYFALPTMATSNAMYARMGALHRKFFDAAAQPSLVLAHGARELNTDFAQALMATQPDEADYTAQDTSATTRCNQWFGDSRKKALLADVGVGTIDQVLMGLLPFRHQSLRLYGLARKVLIVDEVHAYDLYMQTLLEQLLRHHARQGGSAILLTATLPLAMRQSLVQAWQTGLNTQNAAISSTDFPLLTQVDAGDIDEQPVDARPGISRTVHIHWLQTETQAIDAVMAAVDAGECVAWIRNTVDDAVRAYDQIRARHPDAARCILFHSRFAMIDRQAIESRVINGFGKASTAEDRRGRVLICTQVFQESLDCDVDQMISDIAPIDLLIQRAGRLQRHDRGRRARPRLQILAPTWSDAPDADWLMRFLPGTQAVYRDTALLWLTQRVLRHEGAIRLPKRARALVEAVYGDVGDDIPDALLINRYDQRSRDRVAGSMAIFNALALEEGYCRDLGFDAWQDEREIGTRLSDELSMQVVLLEETAEGDLALWAGDGPQAAIRSQCRLRQSQAARLVELDASQQRAWDHLVERHKGLAYGRPWIVARDAACGYDAERGLLFQRSSTPVEANE